MYDYKVPTGFGDTFFIYAFNPSANGLITGDAFLQSISILDGDFICRAWSGDDTITDPTTGPASIQIYDTLRHAWFSLPIHIYEFFPNGQSVVPEKKYQDGGFLRFDLLNINPKLNTNIGTGVSVYADQLCFYGVRRNAGATGDPAPSTYKYYEKEYTITFDFSINKNGIATPATGLPNPDSYVVPIDDFDFELRQLYYTSSNTEESPFAILLYNQSWRQISNIPININRIAQTSDNGIGATVTAFNPYPSPPLLYPVNSVIRFNIYSMIPLGDTLPATVSISFRGVRRIPC